MSPITIAPAPATFDDIHRFDVLADGLGRYDVLVGLPAGYDASPSRYPVIYVTDGQLLFWDTLGVVRFLSLGVAPPAIVVAVGYPADEGMAGWYGRRNFDFTPGPWDMEDELGVLLQAQFAHYRTAEGRPDLEMRAGGAERFLRFLRDELDPAIRQTYRADASRPTLIGDSSGGCFVLYALLSGASPFGQYVCISPAVGLSNGGLYDLETAYARNHADLDARLFLCAGSEEMKNRIMALCGIVSGVTRLTEAFAKRGYPSLIVESQVMEGETHHSIFPRAIMHGLLHASGKPVRDVPLGDAPTELPSDGRVAPGPGSSGDP